MASTAPQQEFMFVDFHRENVSTRKARQVFAQNTYQRKKRLAAVERLKTSTTQRLRQQLPFRYTGTGTGTGTRDGPPGHAVAATKSDPTTENQNQSQIAKSPSWSWIDFSSPKTHLGQGFVDPFASSVVPMTDIMNSYFHHLRTFTIAQSYPLDAPRMKIWWWQKALSEPAIQQALLCSAASHQTALNTLNGVAPQYMRSSVREFLRLRGDTIKTLNGRLRDPGAVAESTILIVASLRAIEAISASVDGVTAHTKGLEILINLYGGLDALEHLTVSKIYHGDIIRAALTNTPTLPLTPKWRAEILQELKLFGTSTSSGGFLSMLDPQVHKQLSRLGSSFLAGPWYTMLPETMQSTLMISQRLIQYYEAAQIYPTLIKPTDNDLFVVLMHRLVSDPYTETQTNGNGRRHGNGRSINDPLRFALLIYLNTRVWHLQSFPIMARLVGTLQGSLLAVTATFDIIIGNGTADAEAAAVGRSKPQSVLAHLKTLAPSLTFWILFIGAMASHGHAGHCWFLAQLADCTLDLGLDGGPGGWMAARDILEGFFYTEQKDEVGGEEVWSEVCVLIQARAALEPSATARSVKDEDEVFGVGVSGGGGFGL